MARCMEDQLSLTINDRQQWWTRREAAEFLRLSERSIDRYARTGLLTPVRIAGTSVRFPREEVMRLIDARRS